MKTSNKILTGFLALVFLVPLLTASALKSKVKNGKYTVVKNENANSVKKIDRDLHRVNVLDIAAPNPDLLHCRLRTADRMKYVYHQYSANDSLTVYQRNDTLFIRHPSVIQNKPGGRVFFEIDVYLPGFEKLVLDGATAFIDSVAGSSGTFTVALKNGGRISGE